MRDVENKSITKVLSLWILYEMTFYVGKYIKSLENKVFRHPITDLNPSKFSCKNEALKCRFTKKTNICMEEIILKPVNYM